MLDIRDQVHSCSSFFLLLHSSPFSCDFSVFQLAHVAIHYNQVAATYELFLLKKRASQKAKLILEKFFGTNPFWRRVPLGGFIFLVKINKKIYEKNNEKAWPDLTWPGLID